MFVFRHGSRRAARLAATPTARCYASRIDIPMPPASRGSSLQTIDACPSPTCQCREMPSGLDIEREQNINGSMASYAEQVLISTGRSDWKSRIEEDEEDGAFVRQIKSFIGPKGKYSDPYHSVLITNSSLPPSEHPPPQHQHPSQPATASGSIPVSRPGKASDPTPAASRPASAFLLPSFQYVPTIPTTDSAVETFAQAFLLPTQLHASHDRLTREQQRLLLRQPELQRQFPGARKVDEILILICGHGGRDARCGVLGPILQAEFEEKLQRQNIALPGDAPVAEAEIGHTDSQPYVPTARVGLISHIGGHKWAGNVIIYIPPSWKGHPLAGEGIWYGRVEPANVEGIVRKTVMEGKVIKEMFRGGIDGQSREILRV